MIQSTVEKFKLFVDTDRGVSPVIAVALLILITIGFAVAIQSTGGNIIDSAQEPDEVTDTNSVSTDVTRFGDGIATLSIGGTWDFNIDNDPPDSTNGEYIVRSLQPINFDTVETVHVQWEHESTSTEVQDVSYLGIDPDFERINRNNARSNDLEAVIYNENENFDSRTEQLDATGLTGDQYVGVGAQLSSDHNQFINLEIWRVWGENSNGDVVFELKDP